MRRTHFAVWATVALWLTGCGPAVGGARHTLVTRNFSGTLRPSRFLTSTTPAFGLDAVDFVTSTEAIAAASDGSGSQIFRSNSSGTSWTVQAKTSVTINQIDMVSALKGWALGQNCGAADGCGGSVLLETLNGGHSWSTVFHTRQRRIEHITFVSAQTGWLLVSSPSQGLKLEKTENGGRSWVGVPTPSAFGGALGGTMDFINAAVGWFLSGGGPSAGSQSKILYGTSDGGQHWSPITQSPTLNHPTANLGNTLPLSGYVNDLFFLNRRQGWMSLARGGVYQTQDGGRIWTPVWERAFPPGSLELTSLGFLGPRARAGWALEASGAGLFTTANEGQSWARAYPRPAPDLSLSFSNAKSGVGLLQSATGAEVVMETADGGQHWHVQAISPGPLTAVQQVAPHGFWASASNGKLYRSTTEGKTWRAVALPDGYWATSESFWSARNGMAIGHALSSGTLVWGAFRTADAGRRWTAISLPFVPQTLDAINHHDWWALGYSRRLIARRNAVLGGHQITMKTKQYLVAHPLISTLYHTNNGGRTWTQYQDTLWKRPGQSPFGIRFLSSQVGIVWSGKDFWKTLNGGITWVGYESPRAITFQTVDFVQSHEGWALINNGSTIWSTHDGGATWNVVGP